jgi:bifunctional DNA-binding transcriptional regulator/antitoxin component of YhaV-PrlF toxin-antitoxin module
LKVAMKMQKILKVLGKRGRITIPWEIRRALGFHYNDVVSFAQDGDAVLVKREKLCDGCKATDSEPCGVESALHELLDDLTAEELRTALIRLSVRWAEMTKGGDEDA